jgi:hypothetical protein
MSQKHLRAEANQDMTGQISALMFATARPFVRGDCLHGMRPCPFVGCRYHLYLDVQPSGSLTCNFPEIDPDELDESCILDTIDVRGPMTLEDVSVLMNLSRERVRQIEEAALQKLAGISERN